MIKWIRFLFVKEKVKGYWQVKRAKNKQWYFLLKAGNHETLLTSETYHNKGDAFRGIRAIKNNINGKIVVL